jgi:hypothetical protein
MGHPNPVTLRRHARGSIHFNKLRTIGSIAAGATKAVTGVSATDIITSAGHGFLNGNQVVFSGLTGGAGLSAGTTYYVINATTNTFQVSTTWGGPAVDFTTDITAGNVQTVANQTRVEG